MKVEDGTGLTDSDSYVSVVFADNYFSARSNVVWNGLSAEEKEVALVKATDFVDSSFRWRGKKKTSEQSLNFPRINIYDNDGYEVVGIPIALQKAVCDASLISGSGQELFQTASENGAVTSEHIGSLSFTYDITQKQKDVTLYDSVNLKLRGLFEDTSKKKIFSIKTERV